MRYLTDVSGRTRRLTDERLAHIERRPEMVDQFPRIEETVARPNELRVSNQDESVHLFYRHDVKSTVTIRSVPMAQRKRTQKDKQYNQL